MKSKRFILIVALILAILIAVVAAVAASHNQQPATQIPNPSVNDYTSCTAAGYPVQASYPTVCRTPDGKSYVNPDQKVTPPSDTQTGTWCPPPGRYSPCFNGSSTDAHPAGYTFTPY